MIAAVAMTGCSVQAAQHVVDVQPAAQVAVAPSAQAQMLASLRPLLKSLRASDFELVRQGYEACTNLAFRSRDDYRARVLRQYGQNLTLAMDHLTVAAEAKHFLCP